MQTNYVSRVRIAPLARLGAAALVGMMLVGAPVGRALAAEGRGDAIDAAVDDLDDQAPITALGEQLAAKRRDVGDRLGGAVQEAIDRAAQRMEDARRGMEKVLTFGYGLEGLAAVDFSAMDAAAEPEVDESAAIAADEDATARPGRARRLDYVVGTNDPLAGL